MDPDILYWRGRSNEESVENGLFFKTTMDFKEFQSAVAQIAEEKGLPYERIVESIEAALAAAYKKDYGKKGQVVKAKLDFKTGKILFWQIKEVVDESMLLQPDEEEVPEEEVPEGQVRKVRFSEDRHIMLEEAKKIQEDAAPGDKIEMELPFQEEYGRIAAQTAKQVIIQRIREVEKEVLYLEYKDKEGEIISGLVQRVEGRVVYFDLGKTFGILHREEQIPGEFYRTGQRIKMLLMKVEQTSKGPLIFLSRAHPKLISKLFELEVPEIQSGTVEIKAIAREPGSRSKIAVVALQEDIDPIGSMVGQRGIRVSAVMHELGGEKIDIIEWAEDPKEFIAHALSPAKVLNVQTMEQNVAIVAVPEDQLSLAIGKDGQNVRLAAKLTNWKIDVRTPETIEEEGEVADPEESPAQSEKEQEESGGQEEEQEEKEQEEKKESEEKEAPKEEEKKKES